MSVFGPQTTTSTGTSSTTGSGTQRRYLEPFQSDIISPLVKTATDRLTNPEAAIAPIRAAGVDQINRSYAGVPQAFADKLLAYGGGGSSGKFGKAVLGSELARTGDIANFEGNLATQTTENQNFSLSLLERLLGMDFGSDASSSSSGTTSEKTVKPSTFLQDLIGTIGGVGGGLLLGGIGKK